MNPDKLTLNPYSKNDFWQVFMTGVRSEAYQTRY